MLSCLEVSLLLFLLPRHALPLFPFDSDPPTHRPTERLSLWRAPRSQSTAKSRAYPSHLLSPSFATKNPTLPARVLPPPSPLSPPPVMQTRRRRRRRPQQRQQQRGDGHDCSVLYGSNVAGEGLQGFLAPLFPSSSWLSLRLSSAAGAAAHRPREEKGIEQAKAEEEEKADGQEGQNKRAPSPPTDRRPRFFPRWISRAQREREKATLSSDGSQARRERRGGSFPSASLVRTRGGRESSGGWRGGHD